MNKNRILSENLNITAIGNDHFVIWNRFFPSFIKLNKKGLDFIERLKVNKEIILDENNKAIISLLEKHKIVLNGTSDTSKQEFIETVNQSFLKSEKSAEEFYTQKKHYANLTITNSACNLTCSYCIDHYKNPYPVQKLDSKAKIDKCNSVVDQFLSILIENKMKNANISFNGGEILLEWKVLKNIVERIAQKYPGVDIKYSLNTNMTLMTEEIAKFFKKYDFTIYISIDGYALSHNKTRQYHNGKGSFNDIIKGLETYRLYNEKNTIKGFQGTIDNASEFDPEEVYKLEKYGFIEARLAPNLLNTSEEDAIEKAMLQVKFISLNMQNNLKVTEVYFKNIVKMIGQDNYYFDFYCRGLGLNPDMQIVFNLNTLRLTQLCSFVQKSSLTLDESGNNIYNPLILEKAKAFVLERINAIFEHCLDCPLIGICRGGCIYSGLDKENTLNKAACAYQKKIFDLAINEFYIEEVKTKKL